MFTRNRLNWNKALAKQPTLSKDEVKTLAGYQTLLKMNGLRALRFWNR